MSVRSGGRRNSFDLLSADSSCDEITNLPHISNGIIPNGNGVVSDSSQRKRKARKKKKKAELNGHFESDVLGFEIADIEEDEAESSQASSCISHVELRQRILSNGTNGSAGAMEESSINLDFNSNSVNMNLNPLNSELARDDSLNSRMEMNNGGVGRLETMESLDWNQVLAHDPRLLGDVSGIGRSPLGYFMGEIYGGNSLRSTISVGNDKKRQRVYNTMFHVPLRCERLIISGYFFCLDSFLSLLTIMPARIIMTVWRVLRTRQFRKPNAAELSDFGCFIVLTFGVVTLQMTDISLIYHIIRGQGTVKLYVVYNVLEIFDKLCQSFGEDVLQVLFNSAEGVANCTEDNLTFELLRFIFDGAIAILAFIVHSFVLLAQAITLSTCIVAHNNALLALLVSNNFAEVKSNVFKRLSKENIQNLVYYDIVERFHITAFVLFVLAQNILEAEGPWFENFLMNALLVYLCEVFIDTIKHSFLAKFNEVKPAVYSEFLEDLCKQTLNEKPDDRGQDLTFIPLAPACVVIRVVTPIYSNLLPFGPLPWRLLWILIWSSLTYIMLTVCKILVGLTLRRLATWYLAQRQEKKQHID